ncbi:MAG TPA: hypothetical protein VFZ65_22535 [Planctomycetota bacterium]|nr:hypothetical protein [Planctomycetota bacterium]
MPPSAALLLFAVLAPTALAQRGPDAVQALRDMEIAGETVFSRDAIAMRLIADPVTLRALQRRLDDDSAEVVSERVCDLHRAGGYANATASGKVTDGVLRIALDSGTRYRSGEIRCSGNTLVSTATLRERLQARRPKTPVAWSLDETRDPVWTPGSFPVIGADATKSIEWIVSSAYRELGRHGTKCTVRLEPDGDTIALAVAVTREGHEVRIQSVKLDGEDEAQCAAVLAAIGFEPGTLATTAAWRRLERGLEATGRYMRVAMALPDDPPAVVDPLTVTVERRSDAPAPDAFAEKDLGQVRTAIDRLVARLSGGDALRIVCHVDEPITWHRLRLPPGKISLSIGRDGFAIEADAVQWADRAPVKAALDLAVDRVFLAFGEHADSWHFKAPIDLQLQLSTSFVESGEMQFRWGLGFSTGGHDKGSLALSIHPATPTEALARATELRRDGDVLTLQYETVKLRIGVDGEVIDPPAVIKTGRGDVELSWQPAGVEGQPRTPAGAGARNGLIEALAIVAVDSLPEAARTDERGRALVRGCSQVVGDSVLEGEAGHDEPDVPTLAGGGATSMFAVAGGIFGRAGVNRRVRGRTADVCAAFATLLQGDVRAAGQRFDAIGDGEEHGPLSCALIAAGFGLLGRPTSAFRRRAEERWSFDAMFADAADVGASVPSDVLRRLPAKIGASWRLQPELKTLCAGLPAGEVGDLMAWRKGLELLWNSGGSELLRELLLAR